MKKIGLFALVGFVITIASISSCSKQNNATITADQVSEAQSVSIASAAYDNVDVEVDAAVNGGSLKVENNEMPQIKITGWVKGRLMKQLIYNNILSNGKIKNGKINILITYPTSGDTSIESTWTQTITFDDYTESGRQLQGTKTIIYKGETDGVHPEWEVKLDSGKITFKNGKTMTFEYNKTRTFISKDSLLKASTFEIEGTGSGVSRNGGAYTITFADLTKVSNCPYYKSGSSTLVYANKTIDITFDGGSSCTPSATIEVNGKVKTINTDTEPN